MSKKNKQKHKHIQQVSAADLLRTGEEQLQRGQTGQALEMLRRADRELKPRVTPDGKKVTMPPHLIAAKAALPVAMARALAAHAMTVTDPQQRLAALEEAASLAPDEARYAVAIGAHRLLLEKPVEALADFERAYNLAPNDNLTRRGLTLGLLTAGRTQEAGELIKLMETGDHQRRLTALSRWPEEPQEIVLGKEASLSQNLLQGLRYLAKGEPEQAREALAWLPALDSNPTHAEAALIATQFFRSGEANFLTHCRPAAIADWREANRLLAAHDLSLPWQPQLAAYFHAIAESALAEDAALAIEAWQSAMTIAPADKSGNKPPEKPGDKIAAANLRVARRAQALQAWRAGHIEQATAIWQEMLQEKPQDERVLQSAAVACERLERKTDAIKHWRALARLWRQQFKQRAAEDGFKPRLERLEHHLLDLMAQTGEPPQEVLDELEAALRFDPDNHNFRLEIAQLLMEMGKPQRALKHLAQIEQQQGPSATLLSHKAMALEMADRSTEAGHAFEKAYALEPENKIVQLGYLNLLGQQAAEAAKKGNLDRAIEICQKQLSIDDDYFPALGMLASLYFKLKRKKEANTLLKRAIEKTPPKPQRMVAVGAVYLINKQKKDAKAAFDRAVELGPSSECFYQIGTAYLETNNTKEAVLYFNRAAEDASMEMLLDIAIRFYEADDIKSAEHYINKAKKLDPAHPMPYFVKLLSAIRSPLDLIFMSDAKRKQMLKDFDEVEKRMAGRSDYDHMRAEMAQVKKLIKSGPGGLDGALGGLGPLLLGDDDNNDDFFADPPPFFDPPIGRSKSKKKRR